MRISPAGTKREMIAQSFMEAAPDYNSGFLGTPEVDPRGLSPAVSQPVSEVPKEEAPVTSQETSQASDNMDVKTYVAKKLESFGYPPRRLEQFEDDFVTQKIYPGGVREVTIVIPDRYYGKRESISDSDFGKLLQEVQQQFGLSFVDGERKAKKIEIHFTSEKPSLDEDETPVGDELDEVYGKTTNGGGGEGEKKRVRTRNKPVRRTVAKETIREMFKKSIEELYEKFFHVGVQE